MRRCNKASIRENLLFQRKYCVTPEVREKLAEKFKVTVDYDTCIECVPIRVYKVTQ